MSMYDWDNWHPGELPLRGERRKQVPLPLLKISRLKKINRWRQWRLSRSNGMMWVYPPGQDIWDYEEYGR